MPPPSPAVAPWPDLAWSFGDAAKAKAGVFTPSRAAERAYERSLRSLAGRIGQVLQNNSPRDAEEMLREYARAITPWARQSAANMLDGVARGNLDQFRRIASRMGLDMRMFLTGDPIGQAVTACIEANTELIKSLPLEAALRAGDMAHQGLITGMRAEDMAKELVGIGDITMSRARCIALTEVSKASTALTRARAGSVGSEGYIWRSVRDGATRPSHRAMEGRYVPWDKPPVLDTMTGHAGEFPYCRCYPEPVIPKGDDTRKTYAVSLPTQAQEKARGEQRLFTQWEKSYGAEVIRHMPGTSLYNVERAKFLPEKLTSYALNTEHNPGKYKARVFKATIGATMEHAADIEKQVMAFLPYIDAETKLNADQYGVRFNAIVPVTGPNGKTVDVITGWIYKKQSGKDIIGTRPVLTTIYVDEKSHAV